MRDELLYSNVKGRNPFKDARVRRGLLPGHRHRGDQDQGDARHGSADGPDDLAAAVPARRRVQALALRCRRRQAADGGSRLCRGFELVHGLPQRPLRQRRGDLPGGRGHAGAHRRQDQAQRDAQGHSTSRRPARRASTNSSFNLLGWTPGSLDSWNVLANIVGCRDAKGKGGTFNFGGYCNPQHRRAARAESWSRPTRRARPI